MPGGASSSPGGGCQAPFPSPCTGTRSPGATDLSGRDVSVLDADSQAGDEDALDFFQQQDRVEDEGLPTLGQQDGDAGKSLEEEEEEEEAALDPLGIMRYVSPSGWGPPHCLACSRLLPLFWELEKTRLPRSSPRGGPVLRGTSSLFILDISWVFGAGPRYRLPLPGHRVAPQHSALRLSKLPPQP